AHYTSALPPHGPLPISKAISLGRSGSVSASNCSRCSRSLCRQTFLSQPALRMPAIMLAWLSSSEKITQPGRILASVESVASFERSEEHTSELQSRENLV